MKDEHLSWRPLDVSTSEMFDKILDMVLGDQRTKLSEIVKATCISKDFAL